MDRNVPAVVTFWIDDVFAWRERHNPFRFHGDGSQLDTTHLANGRHTLRVTVTYGNGSTSSAISDVVVANPGTVIPATGLAHRSFKATLPDGPYELEGVPLTGLWLLSFPGDGSLTLSPPDAEPFRMTIDLLEGSHLTVRTTGCAELATTYRLVGAALRFSVVRSQGQACAAGARLLSSVLWTGMPG